MAFRPIMDRVLVKRVEQPNPSSITIPEQYQQQSNEGIVIALGNFVVLGGQTFPLSCFLSVGDRVRFGEYNAETYDEKEQLVLVRIQDIRGVKYEEVGNGAHREEPVSVRVLAAAN